MEISNNNEEPDEDIRRFASYILPLLFPAGTIQTESWRAESALSLSADGTYTRAFVGYLHTRHPLRRVNTLVCTEELPLDPSSNRADINLMFVIHNNSTEEQKAFMRLDGYLVLHLNI